jgi:hypothetical protein
MMTAVDTGELAVRTLEDADPQFREFVAALYGRGTSVDEVLEDVFKFDPGPSDVSSPSSISAPAPASHGWKRKLALATTVAGGTMAVRDLGVEARPGIKAVKTKLGFKVPVPGKHRAPNIPGAFSGTKAKVGLAATALGGDVLVGDTLHDQAPPKQPKSASWDELGRGAKGFAQGMFASGAMKPVVAVATQVNGKEIPRAYRIGHAAGTVATTAGIPTGTYALGRNHGKSKKQTKAARFEPVEKVSVKDMKAGMHAARQKLLPNAFKSTSGKIFVPKPPKANMTAKPVNPGSHKNQAKANGAAAQQLVGSFVGTKTGKGIIAVGGGKVGYDQYKGHQNRKNEMEAAYMGYGKSVEWEGTFTKLDEDKQLAFGWASVVKYGGLPVVDKQNDYIDPEDLETAVYDYMIKSRKGGHMHKRDEADLPVHVSDIVESIVFTDEKIAKMGLPDTMPRGWWIGTKIHDPEVWQEVKKGNLAGFSIHGKGRRREISVDEQMGY